MRRPLPTVVLLLALAPVAVPPATAEGPAARWPLSPTPTVVQGFDPPTSPWGAGHRGVDLLGSPGQAVLAAAAGTVRFAGMLAGRPVVVVDHGGERTTYEPVRPAAGIVVGARVGAGAVLGDLEVVGSHCPPRACLHWGLIRDVDDVYLDPLQMLGAGPVRLLPWDAAATPATAPPPAAAWVPAVTALVTALGLPPAVAVAAPAAAPAAREP